MLFIDKENRYRVYLENEIYKRMTEFCKEYYPFETGGILIGNYSADLMTANVLDITSSPDGSKHNKRTFYRSSKGLKRVMDQLWKQGKYYLGEWHYHPDSLSLPSFSDKNQMIKFSQDKRLNCPEPILIIIGGYKNSWNITVRLYINSQEIMMYKQ